MAERLVPSGEGEYIFTEKRSRFIGRVWPAASEAEALAHLRETRAAHHDARHNCWCYIVPGAMRYGDDGEPQGTAGLPMLEVFRREGVDGFVCVVTRYFGGVLLGAGGLARAYARAAKGALDAAGISAMRRLAALELRCPYPLFDQVQRELSLAGGRAEQTEYGADVRLTLLLPEEAAEPFARRMTELSAGGMEAVPAGERFTPIPVRAPITQEE